MGDLDSKVDAIEKKLNEKVDEQTEVNVRKYFKKEEDQKGMFEALIGQATTYEQQWDSFIKPYAAAIEAAETYKKLTEAGRDDVVGLHKTLQFEQKQRARMTMAYQAGLTKEIEKTTFDPQWRAKAIAILTRMAELGEKHPEAFDSNMFYNAASLSGRLDQSHLATRLSKIAFEMNGEPAHEARYLHHLSESGNLAKQEEIKQRFNELLANLTLRNPERVLEDAWNLAEGTRDYKWLVSSLQQLATNPERQEYIPSYVHAMQARALMRWGVPGSLDQARESLGLALEKLKTESPEATWYEVTVERLREVIADSKGRFDDLKDPILGEDEDPQRMEMLRQLLQESMQRGNPPTETP